MDKEQLLKKIISRDGIKDILIHNSEEVGEYLSAISHYRRKKCTITKLEKEIVDLRVMIEYIQCIFNINPELIDKLIEDEFKQQEKEVKPNSSHS